MLTSTTSSGLAVVTGLAGAGVLTSMLMNPDSTRAALRRLLERDGVALVRETSLGAGPTLDDVALLFELTPADVGKRLRTRRAEVRVCVRTLDELAFARLVRAD